MSKLVRKNAPQLYYEHLQGKNDDITVLALTGFGATVTQPLWEPIKKFCLENSVSYLSLDYTGHGLSDGKPLDITIGQNVQDVLDVIENQANDKPVIAAGFCYGGWISLLAAEHANNIQGIVSSSPGVDFTRFLWDSYLNEEFKEAIVKGEIVRPFDDHPNFLLHKKLFDTAVPYYRLEKGLTFEKNITILHGQKDGFTPVSRSIEVQKALKKATVTLDILPACSHNVFKYSVDSVLLHLKRQIDHMRA